MHYTMTYKTLIILSMVAIAYPNRDECPKLPQNCKCLRVYMPRPENDIHCRHTDDDSLKRVLEDTNHLSFREFRIDSSNLDNVTETLFTNVSVKKLTFRFSHIKTFHLSKALTSLRESFDVTFEQVAVEKWIFTQSDKIPMEGFHLLDCPEENVNDTQFVHYLPEQIITVTIRWCKLKSTEFAFQRYISMVRLDLSNNLLTTITRSGLPKRAFQLYHLILSHNPISFIPNDMFENMPKLVNVNLESTSITTLPYDAFKSLRDIPSLLRISGNPFNCNCSIAWLVNITDELSMKQPKCNSPENVKGIKLSSLNREDICKESATNSQDYPEYSRVRQDFSMHTTVPQVNLEYTTVPQNNSGHTTVPQDNLEHTTVPQGNPEHTIIPQDNSGHTTVPQDNLEHTTVPQGNSEHTIIPQDNLEYTTVPQDNPGHTTVPQDNLEHTRVPQDNSEHTAIPQDYSENTMGPQNYSESANPQQSTTNP